MEQDLLRLECLKLAVVTSGRSGPEEILAMTDKFVNYCNKKSEPSLPDLNKDDQIGSKSDNSPPPLPGIVKPDDSVKEHKKYSKN